MASDDKRHDETIKRLLEAQEAEYDNREMVREADAFLNKRDGQWEPHIIQKFGRKPRYTFDECNPLVDDILGEMMAADFSVRVTPSGPMSSKDTARIFEGVIRTIENISSATDVYNQTARIMVGTGIDGWRIVQAFRDDNSFQQDLLIRKIHDFQNCVWFDPGAMEPTMEDADECWVLSSLTKRDYDKRFPEGSGQSVSQSYAQQIYSYKKPHEVVIGEHLYKVERDRELVLMSDGSVYEVNEDFNRVIDELAGDGVTAVRSRKRKYTVVYHRFFDGGDWLSSPTATVFCYLPVVPVFGNYRISESKVIYRGIVESVRDAQRLINYSESRRIEEGALAPRGKVWMTKEQAESDDVRESLETLNVNVEPVQFYDHAEGQSPPQYMGNPVSNPTLAETTKSAQNFIQRTSGTFDEARGAAPAHRSGEAVNLLQQKSDNPKRKWFAAMERAIQHTAKILVAAIPKVYDTQQQLILTGEDGSIDMVTIKKKVKDEQTNQIIELNDLSKGTYDTHCSSGPAFQSRQQETVTTINEMAAIDPSILEIGADVLLNNISAPGIDKIAERKRLKMVTSGIIPESQMTEDEKAMMANQDPPQPNFTEQANLQIAAAQEADIQGKNTERAAKMQLEQQKMKLKQVELQLKDQAQRDAANQQQQKQLVEAMLAMTEQVKMQAETLKFIKEAIGVDAILGPAPMRAFNKQAVDLNRSIGQQAVPTGGSQA